MKHSSILAILICSVTLIKNAHGENFLGIRGQKPCKQFFLPPDLTQIVPDFNIFVEAVARLAQNEGMPIGRASVETMISFFAKQDQTAKTVYKNENEQFLSLFDRVCVHFGIPESIKEKALFEARKYSARKEILPLVKDSAVSLGKIKLTQAENFPTNVARIFDLQSPNGILAYSKADSRDQIRVYSLNEKKEIFTIPFDEKVFQKLKISSSGKKIYMIAGNTFSVISTDHPEKQISLKLPYSKEVPLTFAVHPNQKEFVVLPSEGSALYGSIGDSEISTETITLPESDSPRFQVSFFDPKESTEGNERILISSLDQALLIQRRNLVGYQLDLKSSQKHDYSVGATLDSKSVFGADESIGNVIAHPSREVLLASHKSQPVGFNFNLDDTPQRQNQPTQTFKFPFPADQKPIGIIEGKYVVFVGSTTQAGTGISLLHINTLEVVTSEMLPVGTVVFKVIGNRVLIQLSDGQFAFLGV